MGTLSVEASGLRKLLERLTAYKVLTWSGTSSDPDMASDREEARLEDAHVVSSQIRGSDDLHVVVLDIDHPCYLVKSGTPGHYHLYIDVPVEGARYRHILNSMAKAGIIEEGYARASAERKATMVRLPWVKKQQTAPVPVANADLLDDEGEFS